MTRTVDADGCLVPEPLCPHQRTPGHCDECRDEGISALIAQVEQLQAAVTAANERARVAEEHNKRMAQHVEECHQTLDQLGRAIMSPLNGASSIAVAIVAERDAATAILSHLHGAIVDAGGVICPEDDAGLPATVREIVKQRDAATGKGDTLELILCKLVATFGGKTVTEEQGRLIVEANEAINTPAQHASPHASALPDSQATYCAHCGDAAHEPGQCSAVCFSGGDSDGKRCACGKDGGETKGAK